MTGLLGGFLSPEAGQARRAWLNEQDQRIDGLLSYVLGPQLMPRVRGAVGAANELTGFADYRDAVLGADQMASGATTADRIAGAGTMATGLAAMMVPGVSARMAEGVTDAGADLARFLADEDGGIRVWHGSPHDFDKFSMDKIGTGEGAQAYGHGLYFAENENVAASYRDALQTVNLEPLRRLGLTDAQLAEARWRIADTHPLAIDSGARDFAHFVGLDDTPELRAAFAEAKKPGRLYEVDLDANPEDFLDWDAPLSGQPEVLDRLRAYGGQYRDEIARLTAERDVLASQAPAASATDDFDAFFADDGWSDGWARLAELDAKIKEAEAAAKSAAERGALFSTDLNDEFLTSTLGRNLARASGDSHSIMGALSDVQLSQQLRNAGIPGIRYFDQGSRGAGDGTRNYVVFDENIIEIVKKYGIAGAAAMLGLSAAEVEAQVAQQQNGGGGW